MNLFLEGPAKLIENSDLFKDRMAGREIGRHRACGRVGNVPIEFKVNIQYSRQVGMGPMEMARFTTEIADSITVQIMTLGL